MLMRVVRLMHIAGKPHYTEIYFKNIKQIPSLRGDNCIRSKRSVKL